MSEREIWYSPLMLLRALLPAVAAFSPIFAVSSRSPVREIGAFGISICLLVLIVEGLAQRDNAPVKTVLAPQLRRIVFLVLIAGWFGILLTKGME